MTEVSDNELAAEHLILGCAMLDPDRLFKLLAQHKKALSPLYFGIDFYGACWEAIRVISPCDPVSVWEAVRDHHDADTFGVEQLAELVGEIDSENFDDAPLAAGLVIAGYMRRVAGLEPPTLH